MKHRLTYRLDEGAAHSTLVLWVNGGQAGMITVRNDEIDVLHMLAKTLDRNQARKQ